MEYAEQMLEVYHKAWIFFIITAVVLLVITMVMFFGFRIPEIMRKRRWILLLACALTLKGAGGILSMELWAEAAPIQEGESELPEEPEETAPPEVLFVWRDEQGRELEQEAYYQTGAELLLELTIREENLDVQATRIYLEARNASGKLSELPEVREIHGKTWADLREKAGVEAPGGEEDRDKEDINKEDIDKEEEQNQKEEYDLAQENEEDKISQEEPEKEYFLEGRGENYELREEPGIFCLTIHLKTEALYQVSAQIQDTSGNVPEGSNEGYISLGGFCLDRTEPVISQEEGIVLESECQTFWEKLINQITFGYFCQPDLTVKIRAEDSVSGIGVITYICQGTGGEEEPEPVMITGTAQPGDGLIYEENGTKASTVISLPYSFQGTVRARAGDRAGSLMESWTETKGILIESAEMHEKSSYAEVFVEGTPGGRNHFYREDVQIRFVAEDTFSGIRSVRIQAGNQKEEHSFEEEGEEIRRTWEHILTIPASENNQNEIPVSGGLTDFAGHTTKLQEVPVIHIDTSPPKVEVEWLNQDVRNDTYYKADQTAHITIRERNFVPDQVQLDLTGMENPLLSWTHRPGKGCGGSSDPGNWEHSDDCAWIADLVFDKDGEYSFGISCQDAAGNRGSYEDTVSFVIDKTPPVLLVHWGSAEPQNNCYYARERSAVVEIRERNLSLEDLKTSVQAVDRGEEIIPPKLGPLRRWEEESFRAGITFSEDGRYHMELQCTDLAGNEAQVYHSEEFVIDQTPPELIFEGVADCSANRGTVAPRLRAADTNFDPDKTQVSFTGSNGTGQLPAWAKSSGEEGFHILWGDFEQLPENDDLYRIKATAGDLAGNVTEAELTFSVNRFGSAYELEENTALLAGPGGLRYASEEPELMITEYNPDFLDYYQVTSSREGEIRELREGRDYQVEKTGTKDTWKTYRYRIGKENFEKEGIYLVTLYSEDQAKNTSNNRIKEKSLEFIVDKTGPSVVVTGVKDWERIKGKSLEILADIRDSYALAGAQIYVNGQCTASYDKDMLHELGGMLTCSVSGAKTWQTFSVKAWDEAGNVTETKPVRFLVTEQIRFRFPGDDEPKTAWAVWIGGILLLAGGGLIMIGGIRRRIQAKRM